MQWTLLRTTKIAMMLIASVFISSLLQAETSESSSESEETSGRQSRLWQVERLYGGLSSLFFLHGYFTATFAQAESQLGLEPNSTPQILLNGLSPRTGRNESGFQHDAALFIGSQPTESVSGLLEMHFVRNGLNPVITAAKLSWDLFDEDKPYRIRLSAGRYWWLFGDHTLEWFSAWNTFNVVSPAAAEVVPAHYNEVGVSVEGNLLLKKDWNANLIFSVGNGTPSFELMDNVGNTPFDFNKDRTITTRFDLVPGIKDLHIGASFARGALRSGVDAVNFAVSDPRRYQADFLAYGAHLSYLKKQNFGWRSYWYWSVENLDGQGSLDRHGGTLEPIYSFRIGKKHFQELILKARYGMAREERLFDTAVVRHQTAFGFNIKINEFLLGKIEYVFQLEDEIVELDNDVFNISLTMAF